MVLLNDEIGESNITQYHNSLSRGGHILYVYDDKRKYIENAVNYIVEGIENNEGVIYADSQEIIDFIVLRLKENNLSDTLINNVTFVSDEYLYRENGTNLPTLSTIKQLIETAIKKNHPVRTWGKVVTNPSDGLLQYEKNCDVYSSENKLFTVCAYDGNNISGVFLTELLANYEYFMTDNQLVPSNLYKDKTNSSPSIVKQINLEKIEDNVRLRSEQLTFAGQFAAGICHEIRNPLTTIKGFFQLIKEDQTNTKFYQVIDQELDRIQQITSELLLLAKPHSKQREKHNLVSLVTEVGVLLNSQAVMKSIQIKTTIDDDPLFIYCDDTKVKQVIINLVKNAIEVMENGTIHISVKKNDNLAVLSIKDEGPGIPKDILGNIGQPFFTTKKEGTGLGLIISFNIIRSHGGTIDLQSKEGAGTTFTIKLPIVEYRDTENDEL
ncbi:ATP-binding protein [Aquibacillus salsiterrae]|uniref:histidine kinase n=1 Tax=Aquibacillus salsiterrae TaxID=2950439 RepID=A0A9X4AFI3_9BACI|nr:ATP-binding protein [Aquibacillus salsiterrae]MDC3417699.1 ATP-binding protein [Aquibacillus salsiterrae]